MRSRYFFNSSWSIPGTSFSGLPVGASFFSPASVFFSLSAFLSGLSANLPCNSSFRASSNSLMATCAFSAISRCWSSGNESIYSFIFCLIPSGSEARSTGLPDCLSFSSWGSSCSFPSSFSLLTSASLFASVSSSFSLASSMAFFIASSKVFCSSGVNLSLSSCGNP